jgi:hypothetical protein
MVPDHLLEEMTKLLALALAILACFLSCSDSANLGNNRPVSADKSREGGVPQAGSTAFPADEGKSVLSGTLRVDSYEDNELFSSFFFQDGVYVKSIAHNTQTKKKERETAFFYKKTGQFDHAKIDGAMASKQDRIEIEREFDKFSLQYTLVKSKGVVFPLADIVADEVSDLSKVLSIADNYSDFKNESQVEGNHKIIKFIGFNKTSRFHNSPMTLLIPNGDFITIRDYVLTLENGFPLMEVYRSTEGELTKTYSYKDGQLRGLVYKFIDLQNQSKSLEKRFEYHELNQ